MDLNQDYTAITRFNDSFEIFKKKFIKFIIAEIIEKNINIMIMNYLSYVLKNLTLNIAMVCLLVLCF